VVDEKFEMIVVRRLRTDDSIGPDQEGRTASLRAAQSSDECVGRKVWCDETVLTAPQVRLSV
jgi:hypothetical protein